MPWSFDSSTPLYLQIMEQIKFRIAVGNYKAGDKLASVRELAAEAEVNPNTMQKALSELEREGLLFTQRTSGRFVTENSETITVLRKSLANEQLDLFLKKMYNLGYSAEEVMKLLQDYIGQEGRA